MGAVVFGDGQGEFAFRVVAVADLDDVLVVDDGDGVEVDRAGGLAVVVGGGGELVEVGAEPPGAAFVADGREGGGVAAGVQLTEAAYAWAGVARVFWRSLS